MVLLRTGRRRSPDPITAPSAGAGVEAPDRQTPTQAIDGELMDVVGSQAPAAINLWARGGHRSNLGPGFTARLVNRSLPSLRGQGPAFPGAAANDD